MLSKKAQAGAAAGLIAIIAFLIILYVMMLPEDKRNELLNTTESESSSSRSTSVSGDLLVFEHPGALDPVQNQDREKVLDSFYLYSEKSAAVLQSAAAIHVENGWFSEKAYNFSFKVTDAANTENYVLAYDVSKAYGRLQIMLNGEMIYDSSISAGNAEPLSIDKSKIKDYNSLIIKASGVGAAFWRLNEYNLKNIRLIADFTDVSKKEYKNFFILSATEKENTEKTKLRFVPECLSPKLVGPLSITINGKDLHYAALPDCGSISSVEFDPNYLVQGENYITFRAETGSYFIDRVAIKSELSKMNYPFYYFELDGDDFEEIDNNTMNITLQLKFADKEDKVGELNVNGHLSRIETDNSTFRKVINRYVQEDQNFLQIRPITELNIVDLKVDLER